MLGVEAGSRYARTPQGQWICACDVMQDTGASFYCDCPAMHKMKLVKPSGLPDKRPFMPYFAHVSSGFKRSNDGESVVPPCSGGESLEHKLAKHKLREMVGKFSFTVEKCTNCQFELVEDGCNASILIEVRSEDKRWRYDSVMVRDGVNVIALEIFHRHATTQEKVHSTRQDGLQIAEFRAEDVNGMVSGTKLTNLQTRMILCNKCEIFRCFEKEQMELLRQANFIEAEMVNHAKHEEDKKRVENTKIYYYSFHKDGHYYLIPSNATPSEPTYGQLYLGRE